MNLVVDNSLDYLSAEDLAHFVYLLRKRAAHGKDPEKVVEDLTQANTYYAEFLTRR